MNMIVRYGLLMLVTLAAAIPLALLTLSFVPEESATAEAMAREKNGLPVVGSFDHLQTLLKEALQHETYAVAEYAVMDGRSLNKSVWEAPASAPAAPQEAVAISGSGDYSATNVQVAGVDEADLVKTDGRYIYQVRRGEVVITQASPASAMKVAARLPYEEAAFTPQELYVDAQHLIVIGQYQSTYSYQELRKGHHALRTTKAMIYDIRQLPAVKLVREAELEGDYLSSRKIGSHLYLLANHYLDAYQIVHEETERPGPLYRDSLQSKDYQSLDYARIHYFPDRIKAQYLVIGGLNLADPGTAIDVSAYLGAGENVYASAHHLYVALSNQEWHRPAPFLMKRIMPHPEAEAHTSLYKFRLDQGMVRHEASGEVPGRILNQFSMDEHEGYLRIATTTGSLHRTDEHIAKNHVFILDDQLQQAGKLTDIAPGEKIYSTRFMGDRAYMVTFKNVDPLFVLDLRNPHDPKILGALKIPGYSDYLHPFDEHHVIGFGKDAVAYEDTAYYQGMKIALFDVSEVTQPKEKFKTMIGDRGTDSELLRNHKALLFAREKQLLAFPVTLMEKPTGSTNIMEYGTFTFQGAYVYRLDLTHGFQLRARITHLSAEDQRKAGDAWYEHDKNVTRILTIGDVLYTLSHDRIKAHDLQSLQQVGQVPLQQ